MEGRRLADITVYKERKASLEAANKAVRSPIARLDDDIVPTKRNRNGRKWKFTPVRLKNEINKYFEWCEENDEIPSIKGLMIHCKMYKDAFYRYVKQPQFEDILEHAKMIIGSWIETDIYNTKGMCAGKGLYAKNILGWADKVESFNQTETRVITVDEARAKITMLAPKLLELLKSSTVVNQIAAGEHLTVNSGSVIQGETCA